MRQLYYTLVATIVWLSFVFNLEWLVGSQVLAPFMYVLIPTCAVLAILVLGRYRVSLVWLLAFGVAAYAALEIQFALTHAGESVSAVVTGLAAVVVTILLSGLLGRRLAQLQRLLTNLMVGQPDSQGGGDERLFENAQSVLYREVRRARRYHHALAVLAIATPQVPVSQAQAALPAEPAEPFSFRVIGDMQRDLVKKYVLARTARLLREQLDDTAVVTQRNDHFVVLLPETAHDDLQPVLQTLKAAAQEQLGITLNIGAATFPDQAITFESLVEQAEADMLKQPQVTTQAGTHVSTHVSTHAGPLPAASPVPAQATVPATLPEPAAVPASGYE